MAACELATRRTTTKVALEKRLPESRPLHAGCNPKVSGQLYHARGPLRAAFGERELGQRVMMACCDVMVLTTAVIGGGDYGKALGWQEG